MSQRIVNLPVHLVERGKNDRTRFNAAKLQELADSIAAIGQSTPIVVRPKHRESFRIDHRYELVAGERRLRAVRDILHHATIKAIVLDLNDGDASMTMLAENIARADLDPIDEAAAYLVRTQAGASIDQLARQVGVSPQRINSRLPLNDLREEIKQLVRSGDITVGYAQVLAASLDRNRQLLAVARLRDQERPTLPWFRKVVNELAEAQAQDVLFDSDSIFKVQTPSDSTPVTDPPLPSTHMPPRRGRRIEKIIADQIRFWTDAAQAWDRLGRPFKRQECEAAATALQLVLTGR